MADTFYPSYDSIVQTVLQYYDSNSSFWAKVNNGTATAAEIYDAYSRLPQFTLQRSIDGTTIGMDWSGSMNKLAYKEPDQLTNQINDLFSNSQVADYGSGNSYNVNIPSSWSGNGTDGYLVDQGTRAAGGGLLSTIADKASLAATGINIGCKLGKWIDQGLYNLAPHFWDEHLPSLNPETWSELCGYSETGDFFLRTLFNVKPNDGTYAYVEEELVAYYYQLFRDMGFFGDGNYNVTADPDVQVRADWTGISKNLSLGKSLKAKGTSSGTTFIYTCEDGYLFWARQGSNHYYAYTGQGPVLYTEITSSGASTTRRISSQNLTYYNKTYYFSGGSTGFASSEIESGPINQIPSSGFMVPIMWDVGSILDSGTITGGEIEGVTDIPGATQYPPTHITGTTTDEVLQQLKQEYPDLFANPITETVLQDDGTLKDKTYVPVPWATTSINDDTATSNQDVSQSDTKVQEQTFTDIVTTTPTDNPPDTGEGNASPFIMPTGNASSLWAVYHPSQSQLNAFGAWLWSSDFVEQLKRLFNDPMQAIIGVHKVFAPIPTGGSQTIKCGFLDSGVSSPTVSSQYTEVNCGTVDCREYFGNVFDYDPHTKVSIYLPFIGVVPLKVSEVMRASITVTYGVDVITGACLAKVKVDRDGGGGILYSYGGSCACHYPISSGSYAGIISGIVTSAIGIAGGIATGNPLSAIGGAMAGLHQAHTDVQRSGGFTGCAGAMGPKTPYLIIDRPQTRLAADFQSYQGKPANSTQFIGDCSGFVRATEVHFSAPGVFDEEAREVESLLKAGVKLD